MKILIALILFSTNITLANEEPPQTQNLKQLATEESLRIQQELPVTKAKSASDAQISGILSFNDRFEEISSRDYLFSFAASLQPTTPNGTGKLGNLAVYDLAAAGQGYLPIISLGALKRLPKILNNKLLLGLRADAGFLSQNLRVIAPNGTPINTRLNSSLLSLGPELRYQHDQKTSLSLSAELGERLLTSSSNQSLGQWSEGQSFYQLKAAGLYGITDGIYLRLALKQMSATGDINEQIETVSSGYELGAEFLW